MADDEVVMTMRELMRHLDDRKMSAGHDLETIVDLGLRASAAARQAIWPILEEIEKIDHEVVLAVYFSMLHAGLELVTRTWDAEQQMVPQEDQLQFEASRAWMIMQLVAKTKVTMERELQVELPSGDQDKAVLRPWKGKT